MWKPRARGNICDGRIIARARVDPAPWRITPCLSATFCGIAAAGTWPRPVVVHVKAVSRQGLHVNTARSAIVWWIPSRELRGVHALSALGPVCSATLCWNIAWKSKARALLVHWSRARVISRTFYSGRRWCRAGASCACFEICILRCCGERVGCSTR